MKRVLFIMLVLMQCVMMSAQQRLSSTERGVGYVDGDDITTSGVALGEKGTQNLAALVESSTLQQYQGCKVVGIRFALSESIGRSGVFLYKVTDNSADMLVNATVRRTSDGWNEVRFNSSQEYVITGSEALLFGFAYEETDDMVAAKKGALCFSTSRPTNDNATMIQRTDGFYTYEGAKGNLCVQLIVDMSSRVQKAVRLTSLMTGVKYKKPGQKDYSLVMFSNSGVQDISNIDFVYSIDGAEPQPLLTHAGVVKSGSTASEAFNLVMPDDITYGKHTLTVSVNQIDGNTPDDVSSGTLTEAFYIYDKSFKRDLNYIEQYNTQQSYMSYYLNKYMDKIEAEPTACVVNLYRPGEPLAQDQTSVFTDFYAYTYPSFTVNRFYFPGESYCAMDINQYLGIGDDLLVNILHDSYIEMDSYPAFATINLRPEYNELTRELKLNVDGVIAEGADALFGDMALTVLLTENNVKSQQVVVSNMGMTTTNNSYSHNNVFRTYLTEPLGDKIAVSGNSYSKQFTTTLPSDWKANDLKIVAFVSKAITELNETTQHDFDITNCSAVTIDGVSTGISNATTSTASNAADGIFTIDGVRMDGKKLGKGIYIIRKDGKARKVSL